MQAVFFPDMTAQEFLKWVEMAYSPKNTTEAVNKAASLLRVGQSAFYYWLSGERNPSASARLAMELLVENNRLRKELNALRGLGA